MALDFRVFSEHADAQSYFQSIPDEARSFQKIVELPEIKFPFFIIEDHGFEYGGLPMVRDRLRETTPTGKDDEVFFNIYAIRSEFRPAVPGVDNMGDLQHWHITDWTLTPPRSVVFDQELVEIASDA